MWTVLFVVLGAAAGYFIHDTLIAVMQRPLHDTLYYTAPTGAFSFIIKICTVFGFLIALPVAIYQVFAFFGPLIRNATKRALVLYVLVSFLLAVAGVLFAYFLSLPAALHFLVMFSQDSNIQSLITANEYFNFVLTYILGFALIFQLPIVVLFINRITPLKPSKMLRATRYVILGSFVAAAIITPTPDPLNQFLMAMPLVVLYLLSVLVVAVGSRLKRPSVVVAPATDPVVRQPVPTAQVKQAPPVKAQHRPAMAQQARVISDFVAPVRARPSGALSSARPAAAQRGPSHREVPAQRTQPGVISDFYNPVLQGQSA